MDPQRASPHPVLSVFAIGLAAACLLAGYEFIRSVSTSLFIGAYGAKNLPFAMALGPVGVIVLLYIYGILLSQRGPQFALLFTSGLSCLVILASFAGLKAGFRPAAGIVYVFREAYIVLMVEQYWSFINSVLREDQARKCNGPITGFGSVGAITGATLVGWMAKSTGSEILLLLAAFSLLPAAAFSLWAYRLGGEPEWKSGESKHAALGLKTLFSSRYLLMIFGVIFATQVVSTVLDLRFSGLVEEALAVQDERTAYLGRFYARLNSVAFLLQFVVTPICLRLLPLWLIHVCIPLVHVTTSITLLIRPSLATGGLAYLLFKAFDYSAFRAGKELFYIPLSFDARYRAKEIIDAFGYRFAKGVSSGAMGLARIAFQTIPALVYPILAMGFAGLWMLMILPVTREHTRLERERMKESPSL